MAQSALLADIVPRQLSFKYTLQLWLAWYQQGAYSGYDINQELLFALISQQKIGNHLG
ncbi:MAG: hypothetical protein L3J59_10630 [Methylococcaceae bacterium]|nr:hypothetical protein [Methylococcaceae bacterium]